MPYISEEQREFLNDKMSELLEYVKNNDIPIGEMNFIISSLLNNYIKGKKDSNQFNYNVCNNLIGVLECAKLELYRKVISDYEDEKIKQNGSLY